MTPNKAYLLSLVSRTIFATAAALPITIAVSGWIPAIPAVPWFSLLPWSAWWATASFTVALFTPQTSTPATLPWQQ